MKRYCPDDSKNVSYIGVGLMSGVLDITLSYVWGGGLSKKLVKPWA